MNYVKIFLFLLAIPVNYLYCQSSDTVRINLPIGHIEGTLTIADSNKRGPVAYIIPGSGANDRNGNQTSFVSNCYLMLSDSLVAHGISTLRVDKRMGGNSRFENISEEDVTFDDFVNDAKLWVDFLAEQNKFSDIIIIGHSQGSLVAILAAQGNDQVSAVISLAGAGRPMDVIIREQIYKRLHLAKKQLDPILDKLVMGERVDSVPIYFNQIVRPSVQPFLISWMRYDPMEEMAKLDIPVAIVQGATDLQVLLIDAENLHSAYPSSELIIIENMNHMFKEASLDMKENFASYTNTDMGIINGLIPQLVDFINGLLE